MDASSVIELRQYALQSGRREDLIALFEDEFIEPQRAAGIRLLGQFRDLDVADRFVWLRGFRDMPARAEALRSFYGGPVWAANRNAANATMIDSDNVLLLRPADERESPLLQPGTSLLVATIYLLAAPVDDAFKRFFASRAIPLLAAAGAPVAACFQTEYAKNDFPALPVREGEHAFVWFSRFASPLDYERHLVDLRRSREWREVVEPELARRFASPGQVLRLEPTTRSLQMHMTGAAPSIQRRGSGRSTG